MDEVLKTPQEWAKEMGVIILDPDGWRMNGAPSYYAPTTRTDFEYRLGLSTCSGSNQ